MKSVYLLIVTIACVLIFAPQTHAYTGGLINGQAMNLGDTITNTKSTTMLITDGNTATGVPLSVTASQIAWYEFSTAQSIESIQYYSQSTGTAKFYNSSGTLIHTENLNKTPNNTHHTIALTSVIHNVKKVSVQIGAGYNMYEFDAFAVYVDTTPPAIPTGLDGTAGNTTTNLTWTANVESDLQGYNVYRDGVKITSSPITATTYNDTGLTNGTTYVYRITSVDDDDNESAQSTSKSLTPVTPPDTTAPAKPTGLNAVAGDDVVTLTWTANAELDLASYRVYRNNTLYQSNILTETFVDNAVNNGTTYTYEVVAVDTSNNVSIKSDADTATPLALPPPLSVNLVPSKNKIVVQVSGGVAPYTVDWGTGTHTFSASQYVITGLTASTDYTVTVDDDDSGTFSDTINTGNLSSFIPPVMPNPIQLFQDMIDNFGVSGTIAIAVIGGAVALGVIVILGLWGWRLTKKWLSSAL